jgi:hypothetical protein
MMTDFYSTMTASRCIPCSFADFVDFEHVLMSEKMRLDNKGLDFCLDVEYSDGELFIFADRYFDDESIPEKVCSAIGKLLSTSGQEFIEFGFSQTASRLMVHSHGGGVFRIYNNGEVVWPKLTWLF